MTPEQLSLFKNQLIIACDAHLANGGTLIAKSFVRDGDGKCKCPLSCLDMDVAANVGESLSRILGFTINPDEVWSFVWGFDNVVIHGNDDPSVYALGQELRAKYQPEEVK
jgi:hypothetical protein